MICEKFPQRLKYGHSLSKYMIYAGLCIGQTRQGVVQGGPAVYALISFLLFSMQPFNCFKRQALLNIVCCIWFPTIAMMQWHFVFLSCITGAYKWEPGIYEWGKENFDTSIELWASVQTVWYHIQKHRINLMIGKFAWQFGMYSNYRVIFSLGAPLKYRLVNLG